MALVLQVLRVGRRGCNSPISSLETTHVEVKTSPLQDLELDARVEAGGGVVDLRQDFSAAIAQSQVWIQQRLPLQINPITAVGVQVDAKPIAITVAFQPPLAAAINIQLA